MGLSRIAVALPQISEIDINPLLASSDGRLWAVDALMVSGSKTDEERPLPPPVSPDAIGAIFYPKSIAFVGASAQMGKWGHMLMANTISGGYEGKVFLVNPKTDTIARRKTYPSVCDIDDPIDLAVVTIPAAGVLNLIPQLEQKGINSFVLNQKGSAFLVGEIKLYVDEKDEARALEFLRGYQLCLYEGLWFRDDVLYGTHLYPCPESAGPTKIPA